MATEYGAGTTQPSTDCFGHHDRFSCYLSHPSFIECEASSDSLGNMALCVHKTLACFVVLTPSVLQPMPPHHWLLGHIPPSMNIISSMPPFAYEVYIGDWIRQRYPHLDSAFYLDT